MTLYILKCNTYYKIGITEDIKKRLSCYDTHNPCYSVIKTFEFFSNSKTKTRNCIRQLEKLLLGMLKSCCDYKKDWIKMSKKKFEYFLKDLIFKINKMFNNEIKSTN